MHTLMHIRKATATKDHCIAGCHGIPLILSLKAEATRILRVKCQSGLHSSWPARASQ